MSVLPRYPGNEISSMDSTQKNCLLALGLSVSIRGERRSVEGGSDKDLLSSGSVSENPGKFFIEKQALRDICLGQSILMAN